jgi:hypothetical protein
MARRNYLLNSLIKFCGATRVWDCIERVLRSNTIPEQYILHSIIKYTPENTLDVIQRFPEALFLRDGKNRLPVHIALDKGLVWSKELCCLLLITKPHYLKKVDPVTKLFPFALAAMDRSCDVRTIYFLLRSYPEQIEILRR